MLRCSARAFARCPDREWCGSITEATFMEGSECDRFNQSVEPLLISNGEAIRIIETRKPLGLFYQQEKDCWIGIDNSTGDAWTEEFDLLDACISWLMED